MEYKKMGATGLSLSRLSLGTWTTTGGSLDNKVSRKIILRAYEAGINFFDSAEVYSKGAAETVLGDVLNELPREKLVISSKVFWGGDGPNDVGLSRKRVMEACHGALRRMKLEYLDLYYCHRHDPDTPVEETVRAMNVLINQGKVLYWGTSEWTAPQLEEAYFVAERFGLVPPSVEQPEYNLFKRARVETELDQIIKSRGLGTTTWSPLASGVLSGKYNEGIPSGSRLGRSETAWLADLVLNDKRIEATKSLMAVADGVGCTVAQLSIAWATKHENVSSVILGASSTKQLDENLESLNVADKLDEATMTRIASIVSDI
jgi:voltage-dependent potassium channel beta subunit